MAGSVYALLVGIDEYSFPVNPLSGCRNDIGQVREFLQARVAGGLQEEVLLDSHAKRQTVIDAFREHLGQAKAGDVALLWYSGHGSQQPVAPELWYLEPTGLNQTIVAVDSRTRSVPDLVDKELYLLIDSVAGRGAHTVVVLDCCHSGGATREAFVSVRGIDRAPAAPPLSALIPELQERARRGPKAGWVEPSLAKGSRERLAREADALAAGGPYVALAACRSFETAKEQKIDGQIHGVFSASLLAALRTLPPGATYRDLITAAKCRVENAAGQQVPELYPTELGGIGDQPFFGGAVIRPVTSFVLRKGGDGWEVDAGRAHGMPSVVDKDAVIFAVPSAGGGGTQPLLRVTEVRIDRSLVQPLGWHPDENRQYPVVVASVPMPPAAVVVGGQPEDDVAAVDLVVQTVATAGPQRGPSPYVRVVPPEDTSAGFRVRVATPTRDGQPILQILRGDGSPATADVDGHTEMSARLVVARLEHISQWTQVKSLENPGSALAGAVAVEVILAEPGETIPPRDRPGLAPDECGDIRLSYQRVATGWKAPTIFIRLRNDWTDKLWCVLLDLTDRFRVHPKLFPGSFVAPGEVGAALEGKPVPVALPPGRDVKPGARVQDWFKLLVSEEEFSSLPFDLPRLDEPPTRSRAAIRPRAIVDSLGLRATTRDVGDDERPGGAGGDWTTSIVSVVTVVPQQ